MKSCTNCGAQLDDSAAFCTNCGQKIAEAGPTTQNTAAQNTAPQYTPPAIQLKTNRGLLKYILLSLITFGIYALVVMSNVSTDINVAASKYDGKKTMHFCLVFFIFSWLTCGIVPIVWQHRISKRMGNELVRRGISYKFGASDFWLWGVLGSIIIVGPFIYTHKFFKSMNLIAKDYNVRG